MAEADVLILHVNFVPLVAFGAKVADAASSTTETRRRIWHMRARPRRLLRPGERRLFWHLLKVPSRIIPPAVFRASRLLDALPEKPRTRASMASGNASRNEVT